MGQTKGRQKTNIQNATQGNVLRKRLPLSTPKIQIELQIQLTPGPPKNIQVKKIQV